MSMFIFQLLTHSVENQQHRQEMTLLDLPELEFIDVAQVRIDKIPQICTVLSSSWRHAVYILFQGENSDPFETLLNKDSANFGNWDQGWMTKVSVDEESRPLQNGQEEGANVSAVFISITFLS